MRKFKTWCNRPTRMDRVLAWLDRFGLWRRLTPSAWRRPHGPLKPVPLQDAIEHMRLARVMRGEPMNPGEVIRLDQIEYLEPLGDPVQFGGPPPAWKGTYGSTGLTNDDEEV
jgi:hypothetical protein